MSTMTQAGRHALLDPLEPVTVQCGMCGRTASRSSMTFDGERYLCGVETTDTDLRLVYEADVAACLERWQARRAAERPAEPVPVQCGECGHEGLGETVEDREADVRAHLAKEHGPEAAEDAPEPDEAEAAPDAAEALEPLPADPAATEQIGGES